MATPNCYHNEDYCQYIWPLQLFLTWSSVYNSLCVVHRTCLFSVSQPTVNLRFLSDHCFLQSLAGRLTPWKTSKQKTMLHPFCWEWLAWRNSHQDEYGIYLVCLPQLKQDAHSREGRMGLSIGAANISVSKDLPVAFCAQKLSFLNMMVSFPTGIKWINKWIYPSWSTFFQS